MIAYLIRNTISGKCYVGQTVKTLDRRWSSHKREARKGRGHALADAIRKYGESAFEATEIVCAFSLEGLNSLEEYFISELNTLSPNGYNLHTGGNSHQPSEATLQKMSEASKGFARHKGFKHSPEVRAKISEAVKGRVPSFTGRKHSEETKAKISAAKMGSISPRKGATLSSEIRLKISLGLKKHFENLATIAA
jgi:group I intron endonuclease